MEAKGKHPVELAIMLMHKVKDTFRGQITMKRGMDLNPREK